MEFKKNIVEGSMCWLFLTFACSCLSQPQFDINLILPWHGDAFCILALFTENPLVTHHNGWAMQSFVFCCQPKQPVEQTFIKHGLTLIPAWISYHTPSKVWDKIVSVMVLWIWFNIIFSLPVARLKLFIPSVRNYQCLGMACTEDD